MSNTTDLPILAAFHRCILALPRSPTLHAIDRSLELLGELTLADLAYAELPSQVHRTWARSECVIDRAICEEALTRRALARSATALCAPIHLGTPVGLICIARDHEPFDESAAEHLDALVWQLGIVVERFDENFARRTIHDQIRVLKRCTVWGALDRNDNNYTATAQDLGVSRMFIYSVTNATRRRRT